MKTKPPVILLVDDDPIFRLTAKFFLGKAFEEIEVVVCNNGRKGLEELSKHSITLILLDLNMPVMNGWEFLEPLPVEYHHIPVYIVSSSDDYMDLNRALKFEYAKAFIGKPLTLENITELSELRELMIL
jgi:CheY-like chemotaxis protein